MPYREKTNRNMYHCTLCEGTSPTKKRVLLNSFFFLKYILYNPKVRFKQKNENKKPTYCCKQASDDVIKKKTHSEKNQFKHRNKTMKVIKIPLLLVE